MSLTNLLLPNGSLDAGAVLARLADLEARLSRQTSAPVGGQPPSRHEIVYSPTSAHGFQPGHIVTFNGTNWILANIASVTDASVLGYVLQVRNSKEARIVLWGVADLVQYNPGIIPTGGWLDYTDYYLAGSGLLTTTKPGVNARLVLRTYGNRVAQIAPPSSASAVGGDLVTITGGNVIAAAIGSWPQQTGIKTKSTNITSVPTSTPNTALNTYADGIGHATLQTTSGGTTSVWVANGPVLDSSGSTWAATWPAVPIPTYHPTLCLKKVTIPVTSGGTALIYLPFTV